MEGAAAGVRSKPLLAAAYNVQYGFFFSQPPLSHNTVRSYFL
jgi:hypothetical protein